MTDAGQQESDFTGRVVSTHSLGKLQLRELLGRGTSALVYRGMNLETGATYAVKVNHCAEALSTLRDVPPGHEITVMRRLHQHANVLGLLDCASLDGYQCYVTALADRGDLLQHLQRVRVLEESVARDFFSQLTSAVAYAHSRGVVHRDIKLENVLLSSDPSRPSGLRLMLADWGYAACYQPGQAVLRDSCGSLHYCPPELILGEHYNGQTADVWSLGVVLYALLVGRFPFFGLDPASIARSILRGLPSCPRPPTASRTAWSLVHWCLSPEPSSRPSLEVLRSHSWMRVGQCNTSAPPSLSSSSEANTLSLESSPSGSRGSEANTQALESSEVVRPVEHSDRPSSPPCSNASKFVVVHAEAVAQQHVNSSPLSRRLLGARRQIAWLKERCARATRAVSRLSRERSMGRVSTS
eukprot:CAMPEP_0177647554 /NCGR_PEP_ID=MMETSP0447-20121125/10360_1 /TAXON_ID=0 /ORGANISM="Stygamoeba regulata, Strain BSH-02190019" /LENGTH=411 /DNA_ID=CAMNT_0019150143 /DNA_START=65 /DNA_END=1300 /DNA_ORIENTATION=+